MPKENVRDDEPIAWPTVEDEPAEDIKPDDPPKAEPAPKDKDDDKPQWDKHRQKLDETAAQGKKTAEVVGDLQSKIEDLPGRLQDMVADAIAKAAKTDKGHAPTVEADDDVLAIIDELDEDSDFTSIVTALKTVKSKLKAGSSDKADVEALLAELRERDKARDSEIAQRNAENRVAKHMRDLEREHFGGKSTHRTDVYKAAQEICRRMGFTGNNYPTESTGLLAMEMAAKDIAAKNQAARKEKETEAITDTLSIGRPVPMSGKSGSMKDVVAEMRKEGTWAL